MPATRRLLALFTGVMMLVLVLAESGFACAKPEMAASACASAGAATGASADTMANMQMPGDSAPDSQQDEAPCRFPWAPAGCQSSAPCAPAALAMAASQLRGDEAPVDVRWPAPTLTRASFDQAPELPPPRA